MTKPVAQTTLWKKVKWFFSAMFEPEPLTLKDHWRKNYPELWEKLRYDE